MDLEYVINSGAWSFGGLAIGYLLGRLHARLAGIESHLDHMDRPADDDDHP